MKILDPKNTEIVDQKSDLNDEKSKEPRIPIENNIKVPKNSQMTANYTELDIDCGWAWVVLLASFISCFLTGGICFSFGVYYAAYVTFFPDNKLTVAFLTSIPGSFILLLGPLSQYLSKKIGYMWTLLVGSFIGSLGFILSFLTSNLYVLLFTQAIMVGVGSGIIFTAAISVLRLCFVRKYLLTGALGISGSALGCLVFPIIFVQIISKYGIQGSFLINGALLLNVAVCGLLLYRLPPLVTKSPSPPRLRANRPIDENDDSVIQKRANSDAGSSNSSIEPIDMTKPLRKPDISNLNQDFSKAPNPVIIDSTNPHMRVVSLRNTAFLVSAGLWQLASNVIYFMLSNFGQVVGGLDSLRSSSLISWIGAGDLCGRLIVTLYGFLTLILIKRDTKNMKPIKPEHLTSHPFYKALGYHASLFLHAIVCLAYLAPPRILTYGYMSILAFIFGVGFGLRISLASNVVADLFGAPKFFTSYGLFMMFCGVGGLLGTPLATWMSIKLASPVVMFYLTPSVFFASEMLFILSTCNALTLQYKIYKNN